MTDETIRPSSDALSDVEEDGLSPELRAELEERLSARILRTARDLEELAGSGDYAALELLDLDDNGLRTLATSAISILAHRIGAELATSAIEDLIASGALRLRGEPESDPPAPI